MPLAGRITVISGRELSSRGWGGWSLADEVLCTTDCVRCFQAVQLVSKFRLLLYTADVGVIAHHGFAARFFGEVRSLFWCANALVQLHVVNQLYGPAVCCYQHCIALLYCS